MSGIASSFSSRLMRATFIGFYIKNGGSDGGAVWYDDISGNRMAYIRLVAVDLLSASHRSMYLGDGCYAIGIVCRSYEGNP